MCEDADPWQAHARQRIAAGPVQAKPAPARMEWTVHSGHGPGAEVLGDLDGRHVLELGCGAGHNVAHLAAHRGAVATGIDRADLQIRRADTYYRHVLGARFSCSDAVVYLEATGKVFDVVYSVFGAIGLTDPARLLPAAAAHLPQGGRIVFSVPHPNRHGRRPADRARRNSITLPDGRRVRIVRWELTAERWSQVLTASGFTVIDTRDITGPCDVRWPTTLLISARRP